MRSRVLLIFILMFSLTAVSASRVCDLDIQMINQDPFPASPGDYVEIVFQVTGLVREGCGDISFELLPSYPIIFDPGQSSVQKFAELNYLKDYQSNLLIPYKVRIDNDALDGKNPIEVKVINKKDSPILKTFDLEVADSRVDFEIYVKDYDYNTNEAVLEIINTGKYDIEAMVLEIPKQNNIQVKGSNRQVIGDLDSNDYTTAEFEAILSNGEFNILITYSDNINVRRIVEKQVIFDSEYFTNRKVDSASQITLSSILLGIFLLWVGLVVLLIIFMFTRWLIVTVFGIKKKKKLGK